MEKYRPELIKDIVGNEETVERLQLIAKKGNMPHMIISVGPTKHPMELAVLFKGE